MPGSTSVGPNGFGNVDGKRKKVGAGDVDSHQAEVPRTKAAKAQRKTSLPDSAKKPPQIVVNNAVGEQESCKDQNSLKNQARTESRLTLAMARIKFWSRNRTQKTMTKTETRQARAKAKTESRLNRREY